MGLWSSLLAFFIQRNHIEVVGTLIPAVKQRGPNKNFGQVGVQDYSKANWNCSLGALHVHGVVWWPVELPLPLPYIHIIVLRSFFFYLLVSTSWSHYDRRTRIWFDLVWSDLVWSGWIGKEGLDQSLVTWALVSCYKIANKRHSTTLLIQSTTLLLLYQSTYMSCIPHLVERPSRA